MDTVFFDIDSQIDFVYPAGSLYVPGAERIVAEIAKLNHYAAAHGHLVISTIDAHAEDDPEFKAWPPHCVVGTTGQQKPAVTLLDARQVVPNRVVPNRKFEFAGAEQILLEKQTFNCFTNVNLPGLLRQWNARRYVVYGVVTEICVRMALEGLLKTDSLLKAGQRVELVIDAVRSLDSDAAGQMMAWFTGQGGLLTTVAQVQK
jgi:nicotinamidase/pyrazinamidase